MTEALLGIIIFTVGLAVGYWFGHDDGVQAGFEAGWKSSGEWVQRQIAQMRGSNG